MTLAEDIWAKLGATPGIVGTFGTRMYPLRLPEGAVFPAMAFQIVASAPEHTHDGLISPRERLVSFTVYDTDYTRCQQAAKTLLALVGRSTWNSVDTSCRLAAEAEDVDPEPRGLYRNRVDLYIMSPSD